MSYDVMAALCRWLPGRIGVPVSTTVPAERPREFATVERTGGGSGVHGDAANIALQVWSATEAEAYTLALAARDALTLLAWRELPEVVSCEVGGIYRFPDPDSGAERYQLDLYIRTRL